MKNILSYLTLLLLSVMVIPAISPAQTNFQRQYGTAFDNTFSKVVRHGTNYYVLGSDQPSAGVTARAAVSYVNSLGQLQWTRSLNIASAWNDAVLTPNGSLMLVGNTLPSDATNQSLMGLITPAGTFSWIRSYNVTGREGFQKVVLNPAPQDTAFRYYVLGIEFESSGSSSSWDDVVMLNVNESGTVNWKRHYTSDFDDEFVRDFEVLPNGNMIMSGAYLSTGSTLSGVLFQVNNAGTITGGTSIQTPISYRDLTPANGGGFYAVAATVGNPVTVHLIRYNAGFAATWDNTISNLTFVTQVWQEPGGAIYVTGTGIFNNRSRAVLLRFTDNGTQPTLNWLRYLDDGETLYSGGGYWFLPPNQIAFADGRDPATGGFGLQEAFLSVSDMNLTSCITQNGTVTLTNATLPYLTPNLPTSTSPATQGTAVANGLVTWSAEEVCLSCTAAFTAQPADACGNFTFNNQSAGQGTLTYAWNFGDPNSGGNNTSTALYPSHQFSATGMYSVCVTVTSSNGCTASVCHPVAFTETVPPVITCPANQTVTGLPGPNGVCRATVAGIEATATDNCTASPTFTYTITGTTTGSGTGSADGTLFQQGVSTVVYTARDAANNTSTCSFTVTVVCDMAQCACGPGMVSGPNLIANGDFSGGNTGFTNGYTYIAPGSLISPGQYSVLNSTQVTQANPQWACLDNTTGLPTGNFLVCDGFAFAGTTVVWSQIVAVNNGSQYSFCAFVNNLVSSATNLVFPVIQVFINNVAVTNTITLPQTPDAWVLISAPWTANTNSATIQIRISQGIELGRDFALDDITFNTCTPQPCNAQFNFTGIDNCGTIKFDNQSTGAAPLQYAWNFGDPASGVNNTSTAQDPVHIFAAAGTYTVTLTITAANGCTDTQTAMVQIANGSFPPTIICPSSFSVTIPPANALCSTDVTLQQPLITHSPCANENDFCVRSDGQALNAPFPKGPTDITCTVSDQYGTASCFYTINVVDATPPTLNCPQNVSVLALLGQTSAPANWTQPTATDNCPMVTLLTSHQPGDIFPCGVTTVTCLATDMSANTKTCSWTVTVDCTEGDCRIQTNNCLAFDGVDDRVTAASPLSTTALMTNFTVGCFFRNDRTNGGNFYRLFGWSSTDRFEVGDQNGFLTFYSTLSSAVVSTVNIRDGQWHYLAAVKSGTSVTIYLDGVAVPGLTGINVGTFNNLGANFRIGDWAGAPAGSNWQGLVEDFKIWNQAFSVTQVQNAPFCSADPANTNLITHFSFDQGVPGSNNAGLTTALNSVAGGSNGTLSGFTLNGAVSNWAISGSTLPTCSAISFTRLEGNADRNIPGVTKVYGSDIFSAGIERVGKDNHPTFTRRRPDGSIVWRTKFDITGAVNDFVRTDEGCYLLVGYSPSFTDGNQSFIARVDDDGDVVWVKFYETYSKREGFFRIVRSENPAEANFPYIVAGYQRTSDDLRDDVMLFSIDANGQAGSMKKKIGKSSDDDELARALVSWNGNYILAGSVLNSDGNQGVLYVTNNQGIVQASNTVKYANKTAISDVKPASNTHLILAGSIDGRGLLAQVNASGSTSGGWARQFPNITSFHTVAIHPGNGDIYAVGRRSGSGVHKNVIVKVTGNGIAVWEIYPEIPGELGYTPGYLTTYEGLKIFYTDGRYGKPGYPANENILAAMYDLDPLAGCSVVLGTVAASPVPLTPSVFSTDNVNTTLPAPTVTTGGIPLVLPAIDPCAEPCGCGFSKIIVSNYVFPAGFYKEVNCGESAGTIDCAALEFPIKVSGSIRCTGDCAFKGMSWQLFRPDGTSVIGGIQKSNPAFSFSLNPGYFKTAGEYTIKMTGNCGTESCACEIRITIPECPDCKCDPVLAKELGKNFTVIQYPGCTFTFTPGSTSFDEDCDEITWLVAGPPDPNNFVEFAKTKGTQSAKYTFSGSGITQYAIQLQLTRKTPIQTCTYYRYFTIEVDCSLLLAPGTSYDRSGAICDLTQLINGDFDIDAEAGGMAQEGSIWEWDESAGNPEVVLGAGNDNSNIVLMRGNFGHPDILYQDTMTIAKGRNRLFMTARLTPELLVGGSELVVRVSAERQDSVRCTGGSCQEIARIALPAVDSAVWLAFTVYDSVEIDAQFFSIHVENPFFEDDLAVKSAVEIDQVCLESFNFVSVSETGLAREIKLYPNPTTGTLTLEWQKVLPAGAQVLLFDAVGRIARDIQIPDGATRLEINLTDQPTGIYFVQMQTKGVPFKMAKVVKVAD